jgi:hypothetical protein
MRECTAIVLMPSFVPYVDIDVRSNWFRLTNPKNSAFTMKDAMLFSKAITAMRNSQAECAQCAGCYRPGEVQNLMARVHQLDRELPLQSMRQLVPYENTLGGFEMFNTGITDLAPELVGWYGAPGIVVSPAGVNNYMCGCAAGCAHGTACTDETKCIELTSKVATLEGKVNAMTAAGAARAVPPPVCEGFGTTVFLVGDNFSVHDTKVIAGGVCIPHVQLVSRQIMRVTIPSCVNTVVVDGEEYVAVYAATPYGITNHLHVPVYSRKDRNSQQPCESCSPAEPIPAGGGASPPNDPSPIADANVLRLIPLPAVEENYRQVSYMQELSSVPMPETADSAIAAINQVRDAGIQAIENAQAGVVPAQFVVNVQSQEVSTHCSEKTLSGPVAKQMRTRIRECWHNLRDLLPCN